MKKRDVRLTTAAHRDAFESFYEAFQRISHKEGWRASEVVRHFLDAGFRAVRGRMLSGAAHDENEAEYMRIVKACRHPDETMRNMSSMLASLAMALAAEPVDFIGPVFNEVAADAGMGQFFTPFDVSYLIARMSLPARAEALQNGRRFITVQEPACGVGGMVLAANVALREAGFDVSTEVYWHATDVDFRAMAGCYLQLAFTGCSAVVTHGNTLSLQAWSHTPTPAAALNWRIFADAPKPKQLELF